MRSRRLRRWGAAAGRLLATRLRARWTSTRPAIACAVALALVGPTTGCSDRGERAGGAAPARRPNLVFVVIDTLRADHLGCYGYARETSPVIDGLAAQGLRFARVIAPSSWTLPSLVTLMTGRHPDPAHLGVLKPGEGAPGMDALAPDALTVAERLAAHGYHTAAIGTNPYQIQPVFQLMQGFASVEVEVSRPADWVVDRGIAQLDAQRGDAPLFLYLHFMDAHSPYTPPPRFATLFGADAESREALADPRGIPDRAALADPEFEARRAGTLALYDGAIRFIDTELGRFAAALAERGMQDDTVLVITADHGEAFWDHPGLERRLGVEANPAHAYGTGHGQSLFPELVQVPLVIHGPGVPSGVTIQRQVRLLDVPATLLGLAGLPPDAIGGRGLDLLRFAQDPERRDLRSIAETRAGRVPLRALVTRDYTLLDADGEPMLLRELPGGALQDETAEQAELSAQLEQELAERSRDLPRAGAVPAEIEWQDLTTQLERLGYLE